MPTRFGRGILIVIASFALPDWETMLVPKVSILEIVLRGTLVYIALFTLLRVVFKRETTDVGVNDLLVIVLLADAAQNAMSGGYESVPEGIILVGTIIFWSLAVDWLAYHVPVLEPWLKPPPLQLVRDGQKLARNMRRELITDNELMSQLREQGIESLDEVKDVFMESDGKFSVVRWKKEGGDAKAPHRKQS